MQLNFGVEAEPELSGVKARLAQIMGLVRVGYQYGFIPYVIYLGIKQGADPGMPELNLRR
ncbi:Tomm7p [Tyrophagus putrescentiae]|nr:Tomm7p [Tyrophagus putrescentiae]